MNIVIMGFRDKRHIIYSILKILSQAGRIAFVTPNPCYKQLSVDFSSAFEIDDTDILVIENLYEAGQVLDLANYDYCLWDSLTELPETVDVSLITDHPGLYRDAIAELAEKPKFQFIAKGETAQRSEKPFPLIKASAVEEILTKIETDRRWHPIAGYQHNKSMAEILGKATGINKDKLIAYLKRSAGT